jgi:hypothetical protein
MTIITGWCYGISFEQTCDVPGQYSTRVARPKDFRAIRTYGKWKVNELANARVISEYDCS